MDPTIITNVILLAIAVILLLLFLTNILILKNLKKIPSGPKKETEKEAEEETITDDIISKKPSDIYKSDSIEENLISLFKFYGLNAFTMSTLDGLVISSTESEPDKDAANYSYLYLQGEQPESPNVRLIGVPHKGGTVVGIIKSEGELSDDDLALIERDIMYILRKNL